MARFLYLNLQDLSPLQNLTDTLQCSTAFCICCLEKSDVMFVNLKNCKHVKVLEFISKTKIDEMHHLICCQCHAMLKKIEQFIEQVKDSCVILSNQINCREDFKCKKRRLKTCQTKIIDSTTNQIQEPNFPVISDERMNIKSEHDIAFSDSESDIPLKFIKEESATKIRRKRDKKHTLRTGPIKKRTFKTTIKDSTENQLKELPSSGIEHNDDINIKNEDSRTFSNCESDSPIKMKDNKKLRNIKQKMRRQLGPTKNSTVTLNGKNSKYQGKIRTIILSEEELKEERKRESENLMYLKLPFKCESCIVGFDYQNYLKDHNEKRHELKPGSEGSVCNICRSVLNSDASFKDHMRRHYRRFECVCCGQRRAHFQSLEKHYRDAHGDLPPSIYSCRQCSYSTESYRSYRYHLEKHKGKMQCLLCPHTFVTNSALKAHVISVHKTAEVTFQCKPCNKVYKFRSGLKAHITACHPDEEKECHFCVECQTQFKTRTNYLMHLKMSKRHRSVDDERFPCEECGLKFMTKGLLQRHVSWRHRGDTGHKCDQCENKTFSCRSDLTRHKKRVHEKAVQPRNKICDYCGRGFTTLSILRTHVRTHTGARPLRCPLCAASFAHPGALYTHRKLVHKAT